MECLVHKHQRRKATVFHAWQGSYAKVTNTEGRLDGWSDVEYVTIVIQGFENTAHLEFQNKMLALALTSGSEKSFEISALSPPQ